MSAAASLRRLAVGTLVFGGIMGIVAWQAGGLTSGSGTGQPRDPTIAAKPPDDPFVTFTPGAQMSNARGVRVFRDGVAVVEGEPIAFRVWEGSWDRQRPLPGETIDERRILTEGFSVLLFHTRPTPEVPRPAALEGPNTTRVDADEAELELKTDSEFNATLNGNVKIVRHETDGNLILTTQSLDLEHADKGQGEELRATSTARVTITLDGTPSTLDATPDADGPTTRARLEGTGLDADLSRSRTDEIEQTRITLQRDVVAEFLAPQGAATGQGSNDAADLVPATISCDSVAVLENLEPGTARRPSRWLATFRENVVVLQAPSTLRCELLEIEFEMAPSGSRQGGVEILRVVADGGVVVDSSDEATSTKWRLRTQKSVTQRDSKGGYDVDLVGGTTLGYDGTLRGREVDGATGRIEVQCSGPAKLHTDAESGRPDGPVRGRITFTEDVIARQWSTEAGVETLETEVRAPELSLLGSRVQTGDARLDPETLVANGNETERVHLRRETLTANSRVFTWHVMRAQDTERILLSGTPAVQFEDRSGVSLTGSAQTGTVATLHINADEEIEIRRRHTAPKPGESSSGYAVVQARKNVVMRRLLDERETYRLSASSVDATLDSNWQPTRFRAYDNVVITGSGDRPGDRYLELRGDRMSADIDPTKTDDERWTHTTVHVFGQAGQPSRAKLREPGTDGAAARTHTIEAERISYEEAGTLFVARRNAKVRLERIARNPNADDQLDVTISGGLLRMRLKPASAETAGRPEVLRVEGERSVTLETRTAVVTGQTLTYDRVTGVAIAKGRPARVVFLHTESQEQGWTGRVRTLDSFVTSEEVRAEFDTTEGADGRPRRVTCSGGVMRFFQFAKGADPDSAPALITVKTDGPIEMLPESASASENVEITWEWRLPNGRLERRARLLADRVDLAFDPKAEGEFQDRVKRAVATGTRSRPARLFTPALDATADRVESDGAWIDMLSPWGGRVRITKRDPPESFTCRKARYNYVTTEFEATGADYSQPEEGKR
jgi:lipopolysaccharide export system protein LptA